MVLVVRSGIGWLEFFVTKVELQIVIATTYHKERLGLEFIRKMYSHHTDRHQEILLQYCTSTYSQYKCVKSNRIFTIFYFDVTYK